MEPGSQSGETVWEAVDRPDATLVVEAERTVLANESRLEKLLEVLFRNVDEHCDAGVTVTVRGTDEGFVVADDGPGLPAEIADSLFGESLDSSTVGLGLLIVERIVSGHGWEGSVDVTDGTRFEFSGVGTVTQTPAIG